MGLYFSRWAQLKYQWRDNYPTMSLDMHDTRASIEVKPQLDKKIYIKIQLSIVVHTKATEQK